MPPPPRTAHAPGVSVYRFDAIPSEHLLRLDEGYGGFLLEGEEGEAAFALLVLWAGSEPMGSAAALIATAQEAAALPRCRPPFPATCSSGTAGHEPLRRRPAPSSSIRRDFQNISPASSPHQKRRPRRAGGPRHHGPARARAAARSGPRRPPARPSADGALGFRGVRAMAVFSGKVTLRRRGRGEGGPRGLARPRRRSLRHPVSRGRKRRGSRRRARRHPTSSPP